MRRLKWCQSMLARPADHTIYLATLFGSFDWEKTADCGLNGSPPHRALPALRQLADDLTRFLPSWPGFVWGWVPMFLKQDFSGIPENSTSREVTAPCDVVVPVSTELFFEDVQRSRLHQCSECKECFSTRVGMFFTHGYRSPKGCPFQGQRVSEVQVFFCHREVGEWLSPQSQAHVLCETEGS